MGEYLATAIGFQELGTRANDPKSTLLGDTLMDAVGKWLDSNKAPGRYDLRTDKEPFIWNCYFYQPRIYSAHWVLQPWIKRPRWV